MESSRMGPSSAARTAPARRASRQRSTGPSSRSRMVRIGCSGWQYDAWRGRFYPKGLAQRRWLARYAEQFDTVEVNSTFYRLASEKAVRNWVEQTPDAFCFTVKASRYLTHIKRLQPIKRGIRRFYA